MTSHMRPVHLLIFIPLLIATFFFGFYIKHRSNDANNLAELRFQSPLNSGASIYKTFGVSKTETPAHRRLHLKDRKCNIYNHVSPIQFLNSTLKYSKGTAIIYVHYKGDVVSDFLLTTHSWEKEYIAGLETAFNIDPRLNLIDIGSNIGVYTIVGAMRQRKVVAIDANIENVKRVKKSLVKNKVANNVKLLHNAISDKYSTFSIVTPRKGNIGDTFLGNKTTSKDATSVKSIYLDDILEVTDFNRAIMKIDIQGHEVEAFRKADKLFTEVEIPFVFMEWVLIGVDKDKTVPESIISFFARFGYKAYKDMFSDVELDGNYTKWPYDIVWKRN